MADTYRDYKGLQAHAVIGRDYVILSREGGLQYAIMAPHGGGIEPGTCAIADSVAGQQHVFYAFKGIRPVGNLDLHLTSNNFDEPLGLQIAAMAEIVVTIHGCRGTNAAIFVGGRHQKLKIRLTERLNHAGFAAQISMQAGLRGLHPDNLCNRGRDGKGIQLEITRGLREKMFQSLHRRSWRLKTDCFYQFVAAVQKALT